MVLEVAHRGPELRQLASEVVTYLFPGLSSIIKHVDQTSNIKCQSIKHTRIRSYKNTRMQNENKADTQMRNEAGTLAAGHPRGRRIIAK